jgi:Na+-transporting methylmalonyl-CoA/oxaloacetate decarboxylase gamma subunit
MKYLIVLGLLVYVIYKVGSFFFRAGAAAQELKNYKQQQPRQANPGPAKKKAKVNGGEYIDYEEIK